MRIEPLGRNAKSIEIPVGQKVDVYVPEGDFQGIYYSYIYDMDDEYIYLLKPTNDRGLRALVRRGDEIYVSFVDERRRRIGFSTTLVDTLEKSGNQLYKVKKPEGEIYIVEFRENFRVDVLAEATVVYYKRGRLVKTKGTVIDISASGARISLDVSIRDELDVGDLVFITFEVEGIKIQNMEAKVVRKSLSKTEGVYHYGIKFLALDRRLEDKLIKFCIHKQFELARKMKGLT